ncbi:hypothetical protein FNYG_15621 [Fusarium nygamai]|uniref:Rhodopsin domain-containing protein n=1 Tax=Gibberella nygamai TaxID=42673 RepID=A0A2K0U9H7_GIBNY|nr:hypothetical protein FNYG_15621 [Fusarium nygamai]
MTNLVPNIWAGIVIPMPFAAFALALRFKARRMTRMGIGYDDGLCVAAWLLAVVFSAIVLICVQHFKLGQKIGQLPLSQIDYYLEKLKYFLFISEFFYSWSIFLSKLAVLTFYRRMFQLLPIRWPILILTLACVVWILIRTFMTILRCWPVQYFWDRSINGRCTINAATYYFATDLTHSLLDTLILALPLFEVLRMKLPLGQKIAIAGLFSCGFLVCIASIFQVIQAQKYNPNSLETPYQLALSLTWSGVELHMAIFASCLALLRPIFRKLLPGLSTGDSSGASRPSLALHPSSSFRNAVRSPRDEEASNSHLTITTDSAG